MGRPRPRRQLARASNQAGPSALSPPVELGLGLRCHRQSSRLMGSSAAEGYFPGASTWRSKEMADCPDEVSASGRRLPAGRPTTVPFRVCDVVLNSVLARAEDDLPELAVSTTHLTPPTPRPAMAATFFPGRPRWPLICCRRTGCATSRHRRRPAVVSLSGTAIGGESDPARPCRQRRRPRRQTPPARTTG